MLNTPGNGANPSVILDPLIISQKWSGNLMTNPVDVETALFGINRPINARDCVSEVYQKYNVRTDKVSYPVNNINWTEQPRASHPAWEVRDLEQNLWGFPLFNPQENVCMPFLNNTNTRVLEKDYFKRGACIPML